MYDSKQIAARVKSLADELGVPIGGMMQQAGMDKSTLTNFRKSMPKSDTIARIADVLGCSVDYLMGRTDIKKTPTPEWAEARVMDRAERIQLMLVTCGWAKEGEELSPAKFAYISNLIELADAYFQETTDK